MNRHLDGSVYGSARTGELIESTFDGVGPRTASSDGFVHDRDVDGVGEVVAPAWERMSAGEDPTCLI